MSGGNVSISPDRPVASRISRSIASKSNTGSVMVPSMSKMTALNRGSTAFLLIVKIGNFLPACFMFYLYPAFCQSMFSAPAAECVVQGSDPFTQGWVAVFDKNCVDANFAYRLPRSSVVLRLSACANPDRSDRIPRPGDAVLLPGRWFLGVCGCARPSGPSSGRSCLCISSMGVNISQECVNIMAEL